MKVETDGASSPCISSRSSASISRGSGGVAGRPDELEQLGLEAALELAAEARAATAPTPSGRRRRRSRGSAARSSSTARAGGPRDRSSPAGRSSACGGCRNPANRASLTGPLGCGSELMRRPYPARGKSSGAGEGATQRRLVGEPPQHQADPALLGVEALPDRAVAGLDRPVHERQLLPAAQLGRVGTGDRERPQRDLAHRQQRAVDREPRAEPVAGGAEAQLAQGLGAGRGRRPVGGRLVDREAVGERDERGQVLQRGLRVERADLERAALRVRAHVPPREGRVRALAESTSSCTVAV